MRALILFVGLFLAASPSWAAVQNKTIEYRHGNVVLQGYFAWDDAARDKRPGVLVVHDWTGHNSFARGRAEQLAKLGYCAFALDMYGKGVLAKDQQEAAAKASVFKQDRKLMRQRVQVGLEVLQKQVQVDKERIAVMGYCFGGTCALELARSGADIEGVVVFHGNLSTPNPADARNIRGKVLILHGADDPVVPPEEVAAFREE